MNLNQISKFSEQLIYFVNYHMKSNIYENKFSSNKFINKLLLDFSNTDPFALELVSKQHLDPLHNSKYPLNYMLWNNLQSKNQIKNHFKFVPDLNDFGNFVKWYRTHSHLIDVGDIKPSKHSAFLYPPLEARQDLHAKLYSNKFVSLDIQHHMETSHIIKEELVGYKTNINLYYIKTKPDLSLVTRIITFIRNLSEPQYSSTHLDLTIFYGNQKKELTFPNTLCSDNMNSGSTLSQVNITIWRSEELYKVLIHELIHFFKFDYNYNTKIFAKIEQILNKQIKISSAHMDMVNESYTETLALVLHTVIMCGIMAKSFDELINLEIKFSTFQVAKIINFYDNSTYKSIFRFNKPHISFSQTSSACSYYIIKYFMLGSLDLILDWWELNGLNLRTTNFDKYVDLYTEIISNAPKNKPLEKYVNRMINIIHTHNHMANSFIFRTMRMSLLDLSV